MKQPASALAFQAPPTFIHPFRQVRKLRTILFDNDPLLLSWQAQWLGLRECSMTDWTMWLGWWCRLLGYSSCYALSTEETFIVIGAAILASTIAVMIIFNTLLKILEK